MLVGLVYDARVEVSRVPPMLSEGSPVLGSVIAFIERQVSLAYVARVCRSGPAEGSAACAVGAAVDNAAPAMPASEATTARAGRRRFIGSPEMERMDGCWRVLSGC